MHQGGVFCHTRCEALECEENSHKYHGHEKRNDFDTGLQNSTEYVPAF
jgi:hypothetical protein